MGSEDTSNHGLSSYQATHSGTAGLGNTNVSNVSQPHSAIKKLDHASSEIKEPLDDLNWVVWCEWIHRIFHICGVEPYVYGTLKQPDSAIDPGTYDIWDYNNVYAQILITNNITKDQMVHITCLNTVYEIWKSLKAIHKTKDYQVSITIQHALFKKCAADGDNIVEHLTQLKKQWEQLNILDDTDFCITDTQFKTIITSSLPASWDTFMEPYVGRYVSIAEQDPKKLSSSQEFIGILKEEYTKWKDHVNDAQQSYYNNLTNNTNTNKKRPQGQRKATGMMCRNCNHENHITDNCKWLGQLKCDKCS
jgi:hypothetical protein